MARMEKGNLRIDQGPVGTEVVVLPYSGKL